MNRKKRDINSKKSLFNIENILFYTLCLLIVMVLVIIVASLFIKKDAYRLDDFLGKEGLFVNQKNSQTEVEIDSDKVRVGINKDDNSSIEEDFAQIYNSLSDMDKSKVNPNFNFAILNSNVYGVYDVSLGKFLLASNIHKRVAPASLTKVMTSFFSIEKINDLSQSVEMDQSIFDWIYGKDLSVAGFEKGEKVRCLDLLYGAMLPSGADACLGLAKMVAGNQENFVSQMNQRVKDLGLKDTHFVNCVGNDDDNHYSSVYDLSKLFEIAMRNRVFELVASSETYSIKSNNVRKEDINLFSNTFENISKYYGIPNGVEILGGKTGYTENAKLCLIVEIKKKDNKYIICVLNADNAGGATKDCMALADKFLN